MKDQFLSKWGLRLMVIALPFGFGCAREASSSQEQPAVVDSTPAFFEFPDKTAVAEAPTNAVPATAATGSEPASQTALDTETAKLAEAPVSPVVSEKPLPPNLRPNAAVSEIIKMVNAGVDETVLMTYVTNSTRTFDLGADELIYLKDIGIPESVVTAMLVHDQALKTTAAAAIPQTNVNLYAPAPAEAPQPQPQPQVAQNPPPAPPPADQAPTYSTFYSSLAPYGTWVEVDGYGRCWQPTVVVVNPTWSPYCDGGRWVYSDCGWYWASDYSWGWAPFHYGRWFQHSRLGWCWAPDTVWGPSWVSWRYSGGYCGWAPLPPGSWYVSGVGLTWWGSPCGSGFTFGLGFGAYTFVSWNNFHYNGHGGYYHGYRHYAVPHDQARRVYHETVVSTRFEGRRYGVNNQGLPPERVASATRTAVQTVSLRESRSVPTAGNRPDRLSSDGKSMTVYRPRLPETATAQNDFRRPTRTVTSPETSAPAASGGVPANSFASGRPTRSVTGTESTVSSSRPRPAERTVTPNTSAAQTAPTGRWEPAPTLGRSERSAPPVAATRTPVAPQTSFRTGRSVTPPTQTAPSVTPAPSPRESTTTTTRSAPVPRVTDPGRSAQTTTPRFETPRDAANQTRPASTSTWGTRSAQPVPQTQVQRPMTPPSTSVPRASTYQAPAPAYQAPAYQAPAPVQREARSYQVPTYQAPSRAVEAPAVSRTPAPSYQAPVTRAPETPRYSPPSVERSTPAPGSRSSGGESKPSPPSGPTSSRPR